MLAEKQNQAKLALMDNRRPRMALDRKAVDQAPLNNEVRSKFFRRKIPYNPLKSLDSDEISEICAISRTYPEGEGNTAPLIHKGFSPAPPSP